MHDLIVMSKRSLPDHLKTKLDHIHLRPGILVVFKGDDRNEQGIMPRPVASLWTLIPASDAGDDGDGLSLSPIESSSTCSDMLSFKVRFH